MAPNALPAMTAGIGAGDARSSFSQPWARSVAIPTPNENSAAPTTPKLAKVHSSQADCPGTITRPKNA